MATIFEFLLTEIQIKYGVELVEKTSRQKLTIKEKKKKKLSSKKLLKLKENFLNSIFLNNQLSPRKTLRSLMLA